MHGSEQECMVCMETTQDTLAPCAHPICSSCAKRWFDRPNEPRCPTCRGVVVRVPGLMPDLSSLSAVHDRGTTLRIDLKRSNGEEGRCHHVGLTVTNHGYGQGVRVTALHPRDKGLACGLRVGDVITHLNGIAVCDHATAVSVVDRASASGIDLECVVHHRQPPWWARRIRW